MKIRELQLNLLADSERNSESSASTRKHESLSVSNAYVILII